MRMEIAMQRTWRTAAMAVLFLSLTANADAFEIRNGEKVAVYGDMRDMLFAAGEDVDLMVNARDDVFAAGQDVTSTQSTAPHMFLAGRTVSVVDTNATDVIAAGEDVSLIGGQISDDVIIAGRRVVLSGRTHIGGSVVMAGDDMRIDSPIGESIRAAGRSVHLNSSVNGSAYLDAEHVVIGPSARITGDLVYRGRHVEISPNARVDGETRVLEPRARDEEKPFLAAASFAFFATLLGLIIMAGAAAFALPKLMADTGASVRAKPWHMLLYGVIASVAVVIVIALLALTVIGIPLAFLIGAIMVALWPLSFCVAAYMLGMFGRKRLRKLDTAPAGWVRALWAAAGMAALIVLGLIPFIGWLLWMAAYFIGLGALLVEARRLLWLKPKAAAEPVSAAT
jgi:cytoskeletal protein CcmA (bactofilin family)